MRRVIVLGAVLCVLATSAPADAVRLTGTVGDNEVIFGGKAADRLTAAGLGDTLFGKANPARRKGKRVFDRLIGSGGGDTLSGGSGRDVVSGLDGLDFILDGDGVRGDRLSGGNDSDTFFIADGAADSIDCGSGHDEVIADPTDSTVGCELVVADTLLDVTIVFNDRDVTFGTAGDDLALAGTSASDIIMGLGGNDTISLNNSSVPDVADGGPGVDTLNGESGNDVLIDQDGTAGDTLNGGLGGETFYAADGAVTNIDCGAGDAEFDTVYRDPEDVVTNCGTDTHVLGNNQVVIHP
jgi:hypothetical protein